MIRKIDFLWLLAAPVYLIATTFRHEAGHALAALLAGREVTDFVILPSFQGGFTFGYTGVAGDPDLGWPMHAAPFFCDLLTFGVALPVCFFVERIPRWVWLNIVVIGIVGPLANSIYGYQGGFWRPRTDVARLLAALPDLWVHLYFTVTIAGYLLGLLGVLKYSRRAREATVQIKGKEQAVAARAAADITKIPGQRLPIVDQDV